MEDTDAKLFGEGRSTDQEYAAGKLSATEQGTQISFVKNNGYQSGSFDVETFY